MRDALVWLFCDSYLTRTYSAERIIEKRRKEAAEYGNHFFDKTAQKYYSVMQSIFTYKIGPFAVMPHNYLAALMRSRAMNDEAREIDAIEIRDMINYKYNVEEDKQWIQLVDTKGREIRVRRREIVLSDKELSEFDGCAGMFVKCFGEWHLNGVMMPMEGVAKKWDYLVKADPDYVEDGTEDVTGEMLLKKNRRKRNIVLCQ